MRKIKGVEVWFLRGIVSQGRGVGGAVLVLWRGGVLCWALWLAWGVGVVWVMVSVHGRCRGEEKLEKVAGLERMKSLGWR